MTYYLSGGTVTSSYSASGNFTLTLPPPVLDVPVLCGEGPAQFSTCTDLVPTPEVIWDTNWYYRALGFGWPFRGITERMLVRAYKVRVGRWQDGQDTEFLTLALSKLRNREFRRQYDRLRFGELYVDQYVWLWQRRSLTSEVSRRAAAGERVPELDDGDVTEPNEPVVDPQTPLGDDVQDCSALSDLADTVPETWPWGYYLWRSSCHDTERLYRWHRLLAAAVREWGLRVPLAIGFVGRTASRVVVGQLAGCTVALLNEFEEPDEELAQYAASNVREINN